MGGWWLLVFWVSTAWADGLRFAVMPFDNAGGAEFEALGVGLQSMVTTDLARARGVTVVERARLQDLLAEMELGQSGLVDPATAARAGRLVQATHVVVGSFTVVGDRMRLDARAAEVASGGVTFEASKTGEREAFFELEAAMVTELLAKVGAEVSARDRFAIGRHTADFDVFTTFSQGVALFDAGRYAEARRTLEDASRRDPAFELAAVTLADIRKVQERAEAKARAARIAEAEEAFVVHQQAAAREAAVVSELSSIARDPSRTWQERTTANLLLVTALGWGHINHGGFSTLRRSADAFALRRMGEQAYQGVWNELRPRVPEWFPVYVGPNGWFSDERGMDFVFPRNQRRFFVSDNHNFNLSFCADHAPRVDEDLLEMLWVPQERQLDLQRDVWQASKHCMDRRVYLSGMQDLATRYRSLSRFGLATAVLEELTASTDDAATLERIARLASGVRRDAEAFERLEAGSLAWEIVRFRAARRGRVPGPDELDGLDREALLQKVHWFIRKELPRRDPFFLSGVPSWLVSRTEDELVSGPRTAVDGADALRHYAERARSTRSGVRPSLVVLGGVPRTDLRASVTLDYRPADDWWALQQPFPPREEGWAPVEGRPTAGLLVGMREIETGPVCDPVSNELVAPVPLRAIGALVHDGELVLAEVEEAYPEPESCRSSTTTPADIAVGRILARRPLKRSQVTLEVSVKGDRIEASAGGSRVRATLPEARPGFVGLLARGDGYVELSDVELE